MLLLAVEEFFKFKVVGSIIVLTCGWSDFDQVNFASKLSGRGRITTFSCKTDVLDRVVDHRFQGVLYFVKDDDGGLLEKTKTEHFSHWYKWLVIGDEVPEFFQNARYDVDATFIKSNSTTSLQEPEQYEDQENPIHLQEVFVHPSEGISVHQWAHWTRVHGLQVTHPLEKIRRRLNLKKFPLRLLTPMGHYAPETHNETFLEFLTAEVDPEIDSAIRSAYLCASLLIRDLNGSELLQQTPMWGSMINNISMIRTVGRGEADLGGGPTRILPERNEILDSVIPVWSFSVGFTYIAERESSSNMYAEPFTLEAWLCCLGISVILAVWQRIAAIKPVEKDGAYIGVLASWLQQDSSAVPDSIAGRWSFLVMSISAMLVHTYYTSAIVSALMNAGQGGPDSLSTLADSRYAIASEDYDYMRYLFWDVDTKRNDLEYLKKKKITSKFYQDMKTGVKLILEGNTAYHTEYNQIYPLFNKFSDDQLCKLQYIDTVTEQMARVATTKRGQFVEIFKSRGTWLVETGLVHRIVSHLLLRPPPCRAALLAEQVKFGDVAPVLTVTALGAILATMLLGIEVMYVKLKGNREWRKRDLEEDSVDTVTDVMEYDYVD